MNILDINKVKYKDYVVILPKCDYDIKDSVEYSFKNVFYLDYEPTKEHADVLVDFINNKANQLILFDYDEFYRLVLPYIRKNKKIKWILKNNLASLTDGAIRATFTNLMEFCDRNIVDEIGCLDKSTYEVLKKAGYKTKHIALDIKKKKTKIKKSKSIGIIGNDYDPNHNIYNELSALKLVDYSYVKMIRSMPATEHFINFFGIKEKKAASKKEVMEGNFVNLYCNFTVNNIELILKSFDSGVPCILGNTDIFDNYPKLKKYLVLESDDDINEIADKINNVKKNKGDISKEYEKFRSKYSIYSKKSIEKLLK
ncbi:MAG TPA: hypothetical protein IAB68_04610 [Candidatus Aphodocola excrementigallinarum]|uniref:Glycosyltransferase n=1 Tax=Candidatus Aphodocola excrementigallinarum TaxID=2840670 RepID=A0A9D1IPV0_9FIRM|nr:hypothetical protein [Candidatus Aphodocola excrementigallinarum]